MITDVQVELESSSEDYENYENNKEPDDDDDDDIYEPGLRQQNSEDFHDNLSLSDMPQRKFDCLSQIQHIHEMVFKIGNANIIFENENKFLSVGNRSDYWETFQSFGDCNDPDAIKSEYYVATALFRSTMLENDFNLVSSSKDTALSRETFISFDCKNFHVTLDEVKIRKFLEIFSSCVISSSIKSYLYLTNICACQSVYKSKHSNIAQNSNLHLDFQIHDIELIIPIPLDDPSASYIEEVIFSIQSIKFKFHPNLLRNVQLKERNLYQEQISNGALCSRSLWPFLDLILPEIAQRMQVKSLYPALAELLNLRVNVLHTQTKALQTILVTPVSCKAVVSFPDIYHPSMSILQQRSLDVFCSPLAIDLTPTVHTSICYCIHFYSNTFF